MQKNVNFWLFLNIACTEHTNQKLLKVSHSLIHRIDKNVSYSEENVRMPAVVCIMQDINMSSTTRNTL